MNYMSCRGLNVTGRHAKSDETVEVHIRPGVDSRHADQQVRGAVVPPHGTGKKARVGVGARRNGRLKLPEPSVGGGFAEDPEGKLLDFDVVIAMPDMMERRPYLPRVGPGA